MFFARSAPGPGQSLAQRGQSLPRRDEGLPSGCGLPVSVPYESWGQSALLSMGLKRHGLRNACKMPIVGPLPPARRLLPVTGWRRLPKHCSHSLSPLDRLVDQQPAQSRSDAPSGVTLVVQGTPSLGRENVGVPLLALTPPTHGVNQGGGSGVCVCAGTQKLGKLWRARPGDHDGV